MFARFTALTAFIFSVICLHGQDSIINVAALLPDRYLDNVSSKANHLQQKLDKKTDKALRQMMKQEDRIRRKLVKTDSLKAKELFGNAEQKYKDLEQRLQGKLSKPYIASLDTIATSLKFLQQNPQLLSQTKDAQKKLKDALAKVNGLEDKFQKAEEIKKFLKERKQFLQSQLNNMSFARELRKINKNLYYASQQINEYKSMIKDYGKAERKAIELLASSKLFKNFMQKNSGLAALFRLPGSGANDPASQASLAGLQTRASVNTIIQNQIAAGGPGAQQAFQQNMKDAQSQINQLKNKITQSGSGSSDDILPEGFHKNDQKVKTFLKRLEYSATVQTQKATNYFPALSDLGLSLGYKLSDQSTVGIGMSYKMGLGRGWNNIRFTQEGVGLKSFADVKIKGSLWLTAGFEMNYRSAFTRIDQLKAFSAWSSSGLAGLSKVVSLKTKFFKKTKLQLFWDFLSYQQVPMTQTVILRIGYNF